MTVVFAGDTIDAADNNALNTEIVSLEDQWTAYTPDISAGGGSPTVGTGATVVGWYKKNGRTVTAVGRVVFGTSLSLGTGGTFFSLPFTSANRANTVWTGTAKFTDVSATSSGHFIAVCILANNASVMSFFGAQATSQQLTGTTPFTWVATDTIQWEITYEAAS
jgi:hypothetical protein